MPDDQPNNPTTDDGRRAAALDAGWDNRGDVPDGHGAFVEPIQRFDGLEAAR